MRRATVDPSGPPAAGSPTAHRQERLEKVLRRLVITDRRQDAGDDDLGSGLPPLLDVPPATARIADSHAGLEPCAFGAPFPDKQIPGREIGRWLPQSRDRWMQRRDRRSWTDGRRDASPT